MSEDQPIPHLQRTLEEIHEEDQAAQEWANTRYTTQRSMNHAAKKAFLAGVAWQKRRNDG